MSQLDNYLVSLEGFEPDEEEVKSKASKEDEDKDQCSTDEEKSEDSADEFDDSADEKEDSVDDKNFVSESDFDSE